MASEEQKVENIRGRDKPGSNEIIARRRAAARTEGAQPDDFKVEDGRATLREGVVEEKRRQAKQEAEEKLLEQLGSGYTESDVVVEQTGSGFRARLDSESVVTEEEAREKAVQGALADAPDSFTADDVEVTETEGGFEAKIKESALQEQRGEAKDEAVQSVLDAAGDGVSEEDVSVSVSGGTIRASLEEAKSVEKTEQNRESAVQAALDAGGEGFMAKDVLVERTSDGGFKARIKGSAVERERKEARQEAEQKAVESVLGSVEGDFGRDDVSLEWSDGRVSADLDKQAKERLDDQYRQDARENLLGKFDGKFGPDDVKVSETEEGFRASLDAEAMDQVRQESRDEARQDLLSQVGEDFSASDVSVERTDEGYTASIKEAAVERERQEARQEAKQSLLEQAGEDFRASDVEVMQTDEGFTASLKPEAMERERQEAREEAKQGLLEKAGGDFSESDITVTRTDEGIEASIKDAAIQRERGEAKEEAEDRLLSELGGEYSEDDVAVKRTEQGFEAHLTEAAAERRTNEMRDETRERVVGDLLDRAGGEFSESDVTVSWSDGKATAAIKESAIQRERRETKQELKNQFASEAGGDFSAGDVKVTQEDGKFKASLVPEARQEAIDNSREEVIQEAMDNAPGSVSRSDIKVKRTEDGRFRASLKDDAARDVAAQNVLDMEIEGTGQTYGDVFDRSDFTFSRNDEGAIVPDLKQSAIQRERQKARQGTEQDLTRQMLEAEIDETGGKKYSDYFNESDVKVVENDEGELVPQLKDSAVDDHEREIAEDIYDEEVESSSSIGEAFKRQVLQGGALKYWGDQVDDEVAESLDAARGLLSDDQEKIARRLSQEASAPYENLAGQIEQKSALPGPASSFSAEVYRSGGAIASMPFDAALAGDAVTEAAIQTPETIQKYGVGATAATVSGVAGVAAAGMANQAITDPAGTLGQAVVGFGAGTAATKTLEKGFDTVRSARVSRASDRSEVDLDDITTSEKDIMEGKNPTFNADTDAPTKEAVDEFEERAASNPDEVVPGDADSATFHTTTDKFDADLEVGEGSSELPGIFTSPDASGIGLQVARAKSALSAVKPRMPSVRRTDRVVTMDADDVRAMPDDATGSGYGLRDPETGDQVKGGLGRGEAKAKAEDTDLEVYPDKTTSGYEYLTESAEEGAAYVRPTGSRTPELEGVYRPGSKFEKEGVTPVRVGGKNVPEVVPKLGGKRIPGTGRAIPADRYTRTDAGDTAEAVDDAVDAADADDAVEAYDIESSRINRREGQPYTPGPMAGSQAPDSASTGVETDGVSADYDYGSSATAGEMTGSGAGATATGTGPSQTSGGMGSSPTQTTAERDTDGPETATSDSSEASALLRRFSGGGRTTTDTDRSSGSGTSRTPDSDSPMLRTSSPGRGSSRAATASGGSGSASSGTGSGTGSWLTTAAASAAASSGSATGASATSGLTTPSSTGVSVRGSSGSASPSGGSGTAGYTGGSKVPTRPTVTTTRARPEKKKPEHEWPAMDFETGGDGEDDPYANIGWLGETFAGFAGVDVETAVRESSEEDLMQSDWELAAALDEGEQERVGETFSAVTGTRLGDW